jgi:hypothetical protein
MRITYTNTFQDLLAFHIHHTLRAPVLVIVNVGCLAIMCYLFFQGLSGGVWLPASLRLCYSRLFLCLS